MSPSATIHARVGGVSRVAWMATWGLAFPPHSVASAAAWAHRATWVPCHFCCWLTCVLCVWRWGGGDRYCSCLD